jgi:hypothetical protein
MRDELAAISNNVRQILGDLHGVNLGAINIQDVGVLRRMIEILVNAAGGVTLETRSAFENALHTAALREWARSLPTSEQ